MSEITILQKINYVQIIIVGLIHYPDLTGQGKIAQAYKGRYTNPEQVLKDIVTRRRQNQFYRQYMQPERIQTGYFHNMGQANIQKDLQDCFTVYNECGYKGKSLTLCGG